MEYEDFRREYLAGGLNRDMLDTSPIVQFQLWLEQAVAGGLRDPTAMVLATIDELGCPWQRIVLLKGVSGTGLVFYTNYGSAKANAMAREPRVSLHFPWNQLDRQVIFAVIGIKIIAGIPGRHVLVERRTHDRAPRRVASPMARIISLPRISIMGQTHHVSDFMGKGFAK